MAKQNVNIRANDDSVLIKAGQHIRLEANSSITLVAGKGDGASLTLKDTGEILIRKIGLFSFTEQLDERGGKILLNCAAPVQVSSQEGGGGESPAKPPVNGNGNKPGAASANSLAAPASPKRRTQAGRYVVYAKLF